MNILRIVHENTPRGDDAIGSLVGDMPIIHDHVLPDDSAETWVLVKSNASSCVTAFRAALSALPEVLVVEPIDLGFVIAPSVVTQ